MIELIAARGNTSLETALELTKSLRLEIQALGVRVSEAASGEELSRKGSSRAKTKAQQDGELKMIISDMRALLESIEDAVPLINLAITTSGVSLSTNLPASISPSRLLQASTFLSSGDIQYAGGTARSVQIGPTFTLSMYMLFSGHSLRPKDDGGFRNTTWQEVIHKARVKLVRTSLDTLHDLPAFSQFTDTDTGPTSDDNTSSPTFIPAAAKVDEFAYQILLIEDLDDGRVHELEEDGPHPETFDDIESAGIREVVPIHQIAKIFYADTGKILNIGTEGEVNNPVLLLKRDINAAPPRRMMQNDLGETIYDDEEETHPEAATSVQPKSELDEISAQFAREMHDPPEEPVKDSAPKAWRLPAGLDPEWIALEVFNDETESDVEPEVDEEDVADGPVIDASPSPTPPQKKNSIVPSLSAALAKLRLSPAASNTTTLAAVPETPAQSNVVVHVPRSDQVMSQRWADTGFKAPTVQTNLSLLEMLVRLTSLQQFQQASHLTIPDELLNFFLEESSTTGAATGDMEARKRIRLATRARVGFDPYDESPIKRRGEQYQYHQEGEWEAGEDQDWNDGQDDECSQPRTPGNITYNAPSARQSRSTSATPMRNLYSPRGVPLHQGSFATPPATLKTRPSTQSRASRSSYSSPLAQSGRQSSVETPSVKRSVEKDE